MCLHKTVTYFNSTETTIKCVISYLATTGNKSLISEDLKKDLKETYQQVSGISWPAFMKVIRMCVSGAMVRDFIIQVEEGTLHLVKTVYICCVFNDNGGIPTGQHILSHEN